MVERIRPAETGDLNRLVEIYNHYITETHVTFDTIPFAVGERTQWFTQFSESGPLRLLVTEIDGVIAGYASSSPFKPKPGYSTSVETSIYLDPDYIGQGLGLPLYGRLLEELCGEDSVHRAYGGVALPNPASVALHEQLGFVQVATYHEVGYKLGRFWDVSWYERDLST